ncbi:hypothetical protein FACS189472_02980 [Alphaproteobacteria bacterium]|nr:hypothetical protein FACS189472_02980 [Alphaproteobacteria bacterium]
MKNILAVTACLKRCSVALLYDGMIFEKNLDIDSSANLASVAEKLILENNVDLRKIDGIITASGPGSFTGIRVSHSFAKGVAFSLGIPAVSVDYFAVLAAQALMASPPADVYADSNCNAEAKSTGVKRQLHNEIFFARDSCRRARKNADTRVVAQDRSVLIVHEDSSSGSDEANCEKDPLCSSLENGASITLARLLLIESEKNQLYFRHYNNGKYNEGVASYEDIKSYIRNNNIDVIIGNAEKGLEEYREKMIYIDDFRNAKYLLPFSELLTEESKIVPLYINARSECLLFNPHVQVQEYMRRN